MAQTYKLYSLIVILFLFGVMNGIFAINTDKCKFVKVWHYKTGILIPIC